MERSTSLTRRKLIAQAGASGLAATFATTAFAAPEIDLHLPNGASRRTLTRDFPQKGTMILQRARPPLLETPFEVFNRGIFTPNDSFFVRWHWSVIPTSIDPASFRLNIHGEVENALSLSLDEVASLPQVEIAAVNQCSGNSRGFFQPRVAGGEWGNGAMGNARWKGVRLKDVLDRAGVRAGAVAVRFKGLDQPPVEDGPHFMKSLSVDHARDGEVMLAYAMNGQPLPLLNGYPLRLVVPGWYSTYWVKMLNDIEVLSEPDTNFWMATAYKIPDTPGADMAPGQAGVNMVPINRMVPRSFITNLVAHARVARGVLLRLRGIAMGGDCGVAKVEVSGDNGATWREALLGSDEGPYSFREWHARIAWKSRGRRDVLVRCTNTKGEVQPMRANWNPGGYMRNVIERIPVLVG